MWIPDFFNISPEKRLYIVPTVDGLKLFCVNIVLLVIGLIYANNYVLLFNFLVFCLVIASMFYTHFNLQFLNVVNVSTVDVFANNASCMSIQLDSREKYLRSNIVSKVFLNNFPFTSEGNNYSNDNQYLQLEFKLNKRGVYPLKRIMLQTEFPFHLFRSFIYFNLDQNLIVYPELKINISINSFLENSGSGDLNDYLIRDYRRGDNANRILWKKSINDRFIVREFQNELEDGIMFKITQKNPEALEDELSTITSLIYDCHVKKIPFGILTNKSTIEAISFDIEHLRKCLKEIATYEC